MENQPVLMTKGVTKRFGDFTAINQVDLEMESKETLGIIGPNGAGKTTFANIITGFYPPDEGRVFSEGEDITDLSPARRVKRGIVRTFQLVHVFDNLSVFENLALSCFRKRENKSLSFRMFYSTLRQPGIAQKVQESLEMLELDHLRDETVSNLPLGNKKRLSLLNSN